jgi:signal transduction histidine kinase
MDVPAPLDRLGRSIADRVESARWMQAGGLAVLLVVVTVTSRTAPGGHQPAFAVALLFAAVVVSGAGLLVWRRLSPASRRFLFVALLAASAVMVYLDANGPGYIGGFVVASVSAAQLPRAQSVLMGGLALVVLAVAAVLGGDRTVSSIALGELGAVAFYLVGRYSRRLRERTEQAARLRLELERSKVAQAQGALLAERQRVAREMHDVIAHSLSGLLLHIEGARLLAEHDPADPRLLAALTRANQLAHSGLDEARQAIGMLRDDELPGARSLWSTSSARTPGWRVSSRFAARNGRSGRPLGWRSTGSRRKR